MNEDSFNMGVRKLLKEVGVTSQREIEKAVRAALDAGTMAPDGTLEAKVVLTGDAIGLSHTVDGKIDLA